MRSLQAFKLQVRCDSLFNLVTLLEHQSCIAIGSIGVFSRGKHETSFNKAPQSPPASHRARLALDPIERWRQKGISTKDGASDVLNYSCSTTLYGRCTNMWTSKVKMVGQQYLQIPLIWPHLYNTPRSTTSTEQHTASSGYRQEHHHHTQTWQARGSAGCRLNEWYIVYNRTCINTYTRLTGDSECQALFCPSFFPLYKNQCGPTPLPKCRGAQNVEMKQ